MSKVDIETVFTLNSVLGDVSCEYNSANVNYPYTLGDMDTGKDIELSDDQVADIVIILTSLIAEVRRVSDTGVVLVESR